MPDTPYTKREMDLKFELVTTQIEGIKTHLDDSFRSLGGKMDAVLDDKADMDEKITANTNGVKKAEKSLKHIYKRSVGIIIANHPFRTVFVAVSLYSFAISEVRWNVYDFFKLIF